MLQKFTSKKLNFEFTSGGEFKKDLDEYALVIHCGGCMLNEKEMKHRIETVKNQGKNAVFTARETAAWRTAGVFRGLYRTYKIYRAYRQRSRETRYDARSQFF